MFASLLFVGKTNFYGKCQGKKERKNTLPVHFNGSLHKVSGAYVSDFRHLPERWIYAQTLDPARAPRNSHLKEPTLNIDVSHWHWCSQMIKFHSFVKRVLFVQKYCLETSILLQ